MMVIKTLQLKAKTKHNIVKLTEDLMMKAGLARKRREQTDMRQYLETSKSG